MSPLKEQPTDETGPMDARSAGAKRNSILERLVIVVIFSLAVATAYLVFERTLWRAEISTLAKALATSHALDAIERSDIRILRFDDAHNDHRKIAETERYEIWSWPRGDVIDRPSVLFNRVYVDSYNARIMKFLEIDSSHVDAN